MTNEEVKTEFINILESTPGVYCVCDSNSEICSTELFGELQVDKINGLWNFVATIIILKNANGKAIINSISSLLRYRLKNKKEKLGKLNIFIGGLAND